jgi:hypothetical protein
VLRKSNFSRRWVLSLLLSSQVDVSFLHDRILRDITGTFTNMLCL